MSGAQHTIEEEIHAVALFLGAIWAVFFVSCVFPGIDRYGVVPRTLVGLVGIPAMPFLHGNFRHLLSNTIPLFVLLVLLAGSRARSWEIVVEVTVLSGLLLWIFGRPAIHIGASGLIFGLIAFLILSGLLERRTVSLLVAVLVGFVYGGSLIMGIVPRFGSQISWDGHLCGAVAGAIVASALTRGSQPGVDASARSRGISRGSEPER